MPTSASGPCVLPSVATVTTVTTVKTVTYSTMPLIWLGLLFASLVVVSAAPTGPDAPSPASTPPEAPATIDDVLYDQRQNGTENVRIHMNDVTVVVAPSDGLLQLLSAGSSSDLLSFSGVPSTNSHQLPTSEFSTNIAGAGDKPGFDCDALGKCRHAQQGTPSKKNRFRLSNILMPLFNRVQHNNN